MFDTCSLAVLQLCCAMPIVLADISLALLRLFARAQLGVLRVVSHLHTQGVIATVFMPV